MNKDKRPVLSILIVLFANSMKFVVRAVKTGYYFLQNQALMLKLKSCGDSCHLHGAIKIDYPDRMVIGENVHIGGGAFINARGGVRIGDNTHIARNLTLYSSSHNYNGKALPYDETAIEKEVIIGKNVWIGMDVRIIPGVTIGDGAIVGLGAIVSENVPPLAIVGGQPLRTIKQRDRGHYDELEQKMAYGGVNGIPLESGE